MVSFTRDFSTRSASAIALIAAVTGCSHHDAYGSSDGNMVPTRQLTRHEEWYFERFIYGFRISISFVKGKFKVNIMKLHID